MSPFVPVVSSDDSHGKPGSGASATFAAVIFSLAVHAARMYRAVWVQQVSCVNVTSGGLELGVAVGAPLAPTPTGPAPPRPSRNPPTTNAKTNAIATRLICPMRSPRVY